jgi:hypothetical protein
MYFGAICLFDYPHNIITGNFKSPKPENTVKQNGDKQLIYVTRYNVLDPHSQS